jgi:hypothetical protein
VVLPWIEYNNVYPAGTGRCMLFEPEKVYDRTLMVDRDGTVWDFPHQHCMHYTRKIRELDFAEGTLAGFFGEDLNPVVIVDRSSLPPDWAICDMYYDLHCGARPTGPIEPGTEYTWRYRVKYLDGGESAPLMRQAKHVPVTAEDYRSHHWPRLALGRNDLSDVIGIDDYEDASAFITEPPGKVWDKQAGPKGKGALRITSEAPQETVWSAQPPSQIPSQRKLRLSALAKTRGVQGKGVFLRVRYHTFEWRPRPHVEWPQTIESEPVCGTTDWVRIVVPELTVPKEHVDYLVWIDAVLDGKGVAWLADMDVDLQTADVEAPVTPTPVPVRPWRGR